MVKQIPYNHNDMSAAVASYPIVAAGREEPTVVAPSIGRAVSCALLRAVYEKRVVVGVAAAVKQLLSTASDTAEATGCAAGDVVFCVLAPAAANDSAMHMNTILLEAFCYENGIYIVKVDSARKLTRLLNARQTQTCALIQRPWRDDWEEDGGGGAMRSHQYDDAALTVAENVIVDHCEEHWDAQTPVVRLPD